MAPDHPLPVDALLARSPVAEIVDRLPEADEDGAGLRVDTTEAEPLVIDGEVRVSLVRIYSLVGEDPTLVGQVQARGSSRDAADWTLEFFIHDVRRGYTEEYDAPLRWWRDVASRHAVRRRRVTAAIA